MAAHWLVFGSALPALLGAPITLDAECEASYERFLVKFKNSYSAERRAIFCTRLEQVNTHNNLTNSRFTRGINQFSDWTQAEVQVLLGDQNSSNHSNVNRSVPPNRSSVADSVDWRSEMPDVKDQGHCGSCWAFSAIAVVDFFGGDFSEQELIDCASDDGCGGGTATAGLQYLSEDGETFLESEYPYVARDGSCEHLTPSSTLRVSDVLVIDGESDIMRAVQEQVVSVAITIGGDDSDAFFQYSSGTYDHSCGSGGGHAVAVVGYQDDYWIVRNSWGSSWGVDGHIYFIKGEDLCDIETRRVVYASVDDVVGQWDGAAASIGGQRRRPRGGRPGTRSPALWEVVV